MERQGICSICQTAHALEYKPYPYDEYMEDETLEDMFVMDIHSDASNTICLGVGTNPEAMVE